MSGSENLGNENTYDISSVKGVTKKFLEVSRCSRAKQRQRNVQKKCAARAKFLFLQIRPIVVFRLSLALPSPLSITRSFIGGFHPISGDTNNNGEMNKFWRKKKKRANERSFVYCPPAWRR